LCDLVLILLRTRAELRPYSTSYHEKYQVRSRVFPVGLGGKGAVKNRNIWFAERMGQENPQQVRWGSLGYRESGLRCAALVNLAGAFLFVALPDIATL
jgi:hypothetical protein